MDPHKRSPERIVRFITTITVFVFLHFLSKFNFAMSRAVRAWLIFFMPTDQKNFQNFDDKNASTPSTTSTMVIINNISYFSLSTGFYNLLQIVEICRSFLHFYTYSTICRSLTIITLNHKQLNICYLLPPVEFVEIVEAVEAEMCVYI